MKIARIRGSIHLLAEAITSAIIFMTMLLVVSDACMRYLFGAPLGFVYEITTMYILVAIFFLPLSSSYTANSHIRIDIFVEMVSPRLRQIAFLISTAAAMGFFVLLGVEAFKELRTAIGNNEVVTGRFVAWPTWPKFAFVLFGCVTVTINLMLVWLSTLLAPVDLPFRTKTPERS